MVTSHGGCPPRACTTTRPRAVSLFMCSVVQRSASVMGATAGAPSTGENVAYLSHPRAKPNGSKVVGQPENIAVCTLPSLAATPRVVTVPGTLAPVSCIPCDAGDRPVSSEAITLADTVVGARCAKNVTPVRASSASEEYGSVFINRDRLTPARA